MGCARCVLSRVLCPCVFPVFMIKRDTTNHIRPAKHLKYCRYIYLSERIVAFGMYFNEENQKFVSKTQEAGMRCGRCMYHIFSKGRPYSDYPDLVAADVMNGANCGNINHSEKFPDIV